MARAKPVKRAEARPAAKGWGGRTSVVAGVAVVLAFGLLVVWGYEVEPVGRFLLSPIAFGPVVDFLRGPVGLVLALALMGLVVWLLLVHLPRKAVARMEAGNPTGSKEYFALESEIVARKDEVRKTYAQILGGGILLLGAWATVVGVADEREGRRTGEFTRAMDQLGASVEVTGCPISEVRLGGVFGLEQIARESPEKFHSQVFEVLTAYARENSPILKGAASPAPESVTSDDEPRTGRPAMARILARMKEAAPPCPHGGGVTDTADRRRKMARLKSEREGQPPPADAATATGLRPRPDVQAALTAIARRAARRDVRDPITHRLPWMDLSFAELAGASFRGAQTARLRLRGAILWQPDFARAELLGAEFQDATLTRPDFTRAVLHEVTFRGATLSQAGFFGATTTSSNFAGAWLSGADFQAASLTETIFDDAILNDADFTFAAMDEARFVEATLTGAILVGATVRRGNFERAILGKALLLGASLPGAKLQRANLTGAYLTAADVSGADFTGANLTRTGLSRANLRGAAGLSRAQLCAANFDEGTVLPDGSSGHGKDAVCGAGGAETAFGLAAP